ncbi:MAG: SMC family ATPase [Thermoplasmata archaeon]|nr:MAG: SMC family ATPase [Thermoplasmata archaeon]
MILKSIKMQNFRKFKNVEIKFPEGVVGIFGLNGVGKSTIFEAFAWALYGHVAARTSSDRIKRDKALPTERCRVEVDFVFNKNDIKIIREMVGKNLSPSASAFINNRPVASGAEATTRFVQNLFGMDAKTFFTSVFAKQKELNALSTMSASERKQLIMRMLGIDAIDKAIKNIRTDIRRIQDILQHMRISIRDERTGEDKEEVFLREIEKNTEEMERVERRISEKKVQLDALSKELEMLEKEKDGVEKEYETLQRRLDEERKRKELFDRRMNLEREIAKLRASLKERRENLFEREMEKKKMGEVEKEFGEVEKKLEKLRMEISGVLARIEKERTNMNAIETEKRKIEDRKKKIESLGPSATCPTCERVLGEHYSRLIEKFDREIKEKMGLLSEIEARLKKLEEDLSRERKLEEALSRRREYILKRRMTLRRIEGIIHSIIREIEKEEKEIEIKEKEIALLGEIRFDENTYRNLEREVKECYEKYKLAVERVRKKQIEVDGIKEEIKEIFGELNLLKQKIKELKSRVEEVREIKRRISEEEDRLSMLNSLEKLMGEFRIDLISRIRPTLSAYASSLLESLTDGKYSELELNENYDIMIYDGGIPYEINRFSGGEEDLANLCIRLAISQMLADRAGGEFNFIILDEIFGSQDMNRRRNILNALNALSNRFKQIFIITHIDEVKQMVTNAITVYEDEEGISRVVVE